MARPSLSAAIRWIALNDETAETDPEAIAGMISVCLVSDLYDKKPEEIARRVLALRHEWERNQ